MKHKEAKSGRAKSSWFLKDKVRQVLMVPPTPGSKLAKQLRDQITNIVGPDQGTTKVVERGGIPVAAGLQKDNPFKPTGCDFKETCIMGSGCQSTSINYSILCTECNPDPDPATAKGLTRGEGSKDRSLYIGQSGTSAHKRMKSHLAGSSNGGVLDKHMKEHHQGSNLQATQIFKIQKNEVPLGRKQ